MYNIKNRGINVIFEYVPSRHIRLSGRALSP